MIKRLYSFLVWDSPLQVAQRPSGCVVNKVRVKLLSTNTSTFQNISLLMHFLRQKFKKFPLRSIHMFVNFHEIYSRLNSFITYHKNTPQLKKSASFLEQSYKFCEISNKLLQKIITNTNYFSNFFLIIFQSSFTISVKFHKNFFNIQQIFFCKCNRHAYFFQTLPVTSKKFSS